MVSGTTPEEKVDLYMAITRRAAQFAALGAAAALARPWSMSRTRRVAL
jgi:hypothetical protein